MFTEKEIQLLIQFTKKRNSLDKAEMILEKSFFCLIKELDSKSNIVDEPFSVDAV